MEIKEILAHYIFSNLNVAYQSACLYCHESHVARIHWFILAKYIKACLYDSINYLRSFPVDPFRKWRKWIGLIVAFTEEKEQEKVGLVAFIKEKEKA